jgi:hypothetical protein
MPLTLLDEHLRVAGRTKFYENLDQMQADLDTWLADYNAKRPRQGRLMEGRTPEKAFDDGRPKPAEQPAEANGAKPKNAPRRPNRKMEDDTMHPTA